MPAAPPRLVARPDEDDAPPWLSNYVQKDWQPAGSPPARYDGLPAKWRAEQAFTTWTRAVDGWCREHGWSHDDLAAHRAARPGLTRYLRRLYLTSEGS